MLKLEITGHTLEQLKENLQTVYSDFCPPKVSIELAEPKKTKKQKAAPTPTPPAPPPPTKDDVEKMLRKVQAEKSTEVAITLLQKYEAMCLSDLKEKDYSNMVADCQAALG